MTKSENKWVIKLMSVWVSEEMSKWGSKLRSEKLSEHFSECVVEERGKSECVKEWMSTVPE